MSSDDFRPGKELTKLFNDLKEYFEVKYDILRLEFTEKFVEFLTSFYSFFIIIVLVPLALLFFSFAAAFYLGEIFKSLPLGFVLVGGLYTFLILLFFLLKNRIIRRPLIKFALNLFFNKNQD